MQFLSICQESHYLFAEIAKITAFFVLLRKNGYGCLLFSRGCGMIFGGK